MSVNANGMALSDNFTDIESQVLTINQEFDGEGNLGDEQRVTLAETPTGDLDRNELAEILFVRAAVNISIRDAAADNQSQVGNARVDFQGRINDAAQVSSADNVDFENQNVTGSPFSNVQNDAGRVFYTANLVAHPQFLDDTSGAGGGGDTNNVVLETDYTKLGGGPVVDRFDDIELFQFLKATNIVTEVKCEHKTQIWYRVAEVEDRGMRSFGRP